MLTADQLALGIEDGEGRHAGTQAGYQLALLTCTLGIAIFGGLITGVCVCMYVWVGMGDSKIV